MKGEGKRIVERGKPREAKSECNPKTTFLVGEDSLAPESPNTPPACISQNLGLQSNKTLGRFRPGLGILRLVAGRLETFANQSPCLVHRLQIASPHHLHQ